MDWNQLIPVAAGIILALLGAWRAKLANDGKKEQAAIVDSVIDGVETVGDAFTKLHIKTFAKKNGVYSALDAAVEKKGYKRSTAE